MPTIEGFILQSVLLLEVVVTSKPCKRGANSLPVALLGHISFLQR